jgi:hypothetical protein
MLLGTSLSLAGVIIAFASWPKDSTLATGLFYSGMAILTITLTLIVTLAVLTTFSVLL